MYNDHTRRQIINLFGRKSSLVKSLSEKADQIKQSNSGYFFLDHIRNFLQHAGYALDGFSVGSSSRHIDGKFVSFHDLRAKFSMAEILEDTRTDSSIRERMPEIENIDAKDLIRAGIDGVSELHQHLRNGIDEHLVSRQDVIVSALSLFEAYQFESIDESPVLIHEINHQSVFSRYISRAIVRRFESYRKKNRQLRRLSSQKIIS
jgi:putative component of toxin-antitoxin plasmid stabilization module